MRDGPGVGARAIRALDEGTELGILDGPVEADGYQWFEIRVYEPSTDISGWVAAGSQDDPWLEPLGNLATDDLVVRLESHGHVTSRFSPPSLILLEDGRLITLQQDPDEFRLLERKMTADGVEMVRAELAASGLFEAPAFLEPERRANMEPPGHGIGTYVFVVPTTGGVISVTSWSDYEPEFYLPTASVDQAIALAERLMTLESWLPDEAWAEREPQPYAAQDFLLLVTVLPLFPDAAISDVDLADVVWPLSESVDQLGEPIADGLARCASITRAEAESLREAMIAAGWPTPEIDNPGGVYVTLNWAERESYINFELFGLRPGQEQVCSDQLLGY